MLREIHHVMEKLADDLDSDSPAVHCTLHTDVLLIVIIFPLNYFWPYVNKMCDNFIFELH